MYTIYICFSSWSKRSELWKKSEEDKVKLLDMCSASEDNKGLIRHELKAFRWANLCKILLIPTLETVNHFCSLYWLASYLKHKEVFVLAICRACSQFTFNVSWEVWLVFEHALSLKEFIYKLSIINKCLNTHVHTISSNLLVLDLT